MLFKIQSKNRRKLNDLIKQKRSSTFIIIAYRLKNHQFPIILKISFGTFFFKKNNHPSSRVEIINFLFEIHIISYKNIYFDEAIIKINT